MEKIYGEINKRNLDLEEKVVLGRMNSMKD